MISQSYKFAFVVSLLLINAFAQGPPIESGPFRQPDLVEIVKLDPTIRLDIRYATKNNFVGKRSTSSRAPFSSGLPLKRWSELIRHFEKWAMALLSLTVTVPGQ